MSDKKNIFTTTEKNRIAKEKKSDKRLRLALFLLFLLFFLPACDSSKRPCTTPFSDTATKTAQFIAQTMKADNMVGLTIALVSDGRIVWAEGFGWADKENRIPASPETAYMLGSGSKTLTTVALLQLMERGLVFLDDPADRHLPEFRLAPRYPDQMALITVQRLLNHHSGLPGDIYNGGFVEEAWNQWGCNLYIDWLFNYLKDDYPSYEPGEISVYCNTGFVLAGEIALRLGGIEGETFDEFMIRQLFQPLKMDSSDFRATPSMAVGYVGGQPVPSAESNCVFGATGGAVTTVLDMGRFLAMILDRGAAPEGERILQPETVALLGLSEKTPLDLNSYAVSGLGLDTIDDPVMRYAGRAWTKNGSTGHFNSFLELLPDKNLGVIVLTNSDTAKWAVYSIARQCLKYAVLEKTDIKPSMPAYPDLPCIAAPAEIAGIYVKKNGFDRIIDNQDSTLNWETNAQGQAPVVKTLTWAQNAWDVQGSQYQLVFKNIPFMGKNHFVMIQKGGDGSAVDANVFEGCMVMVFGEKLPIPAISQAWQNRTDRLWLIENIPFNDLNWDLPFLELEETGGVLLIRQGHNLQTVFPQSDILAFIKGLANRNGSAVRIKNDAGAEKLIFGGYEAIPIEQAILVAEGDAATGNVDFHKTDWYRFDSAGPGGDVVFSIKDGVGGYRLRLFNNDLTDLVAWGDDHISWTSEQGTFYLAACRTPSAPADYILEVSP